jgi:hypothetical protein
MKRLRPADRMRQRRKRTAKKAKRPAVWFMLPPAPPAFGSARDLMAALRKWISADLPR